MDNLICSCCKSTRITRKGIDFCCQSCGRRWKDSTEAFRCVLKRIKSEANKNKYISICTCPCNDEEKRIWEICERFWPKEYIKRLDIDNYPINDCLADSTAQRLLAELERLLDQQGWK